METVTWLVLMHLVMISCAKSVSLQQNINLKLIDNKVSRNIGIENRNIVKVMLQRKRRQVDISDEWLTSPSTRNLDNINGKSGSYMNSLRNSDSVKSLEIKIPEYLSLRKLSQDDGKKVESGIKNDTLLEANPIVPSKASSTNARLRDSCNETIICFGDNVYCQNGQCKCMEGYAPERFSCKEREYKKIESPGTDPTMIGVVVGLALMSVTLCIVMRLFAKARFRENRTIFNTANPRIINQSLKKGRKLTGSHHHRTESVTGESKSNTGAPGTSKAYRPRKGSDCSVVSKTGSVIPSGSTESTPKNKDLK